MLNKLKTRWDIKSNFQLVVILLIFSIAGSSTMVVRQIIFEMIGVTGETSLWIKIPLYVVIIFPAYQVLFLATGTLMGQFRFAWEFEKKILSRFRIIK